MYLSHDDEQDNISVFCDSVPDNKQNWKRYLNLGGEGWNYERARFAARELKRGRTISSSDRDHKQFTRLETTHCSNGSAASRMLEKGRKRIGPPGDDPVDFHLQPATCERCETVIRRGRRYTHPCVHTSRCTTRSSQSTRSRSGRRPPEVDKRENECEVCLE